jgi:hypothetical protein
VNVKGSGARQTEQARRTRPSRKKPPWIATTAAFTAAAIAGNERRPIERGERGERGERERIDASSSQVPRSFERGNSCE